MDKYQYVGGYGGLWESMDKYENTSVCAYLWKAMGFMRVYGSFSEFMNKYEYADIYGYSWKIGNGQT